jgi:hypothetical protein
VTEPADPAFSERTFTQALSLIEDIRDYIASGAGGRAEPGLEPATRMRAARDLSRLTNRATAAMSILLLNKAMEEGQADDITNIPARLEELEQGVTQTPPPDALDTAPLPPAVAALLARAESLFVDVGRVAALIRHRAAS